MVASLRRHDGFGGFAAPYITTVGFGGTRSPSEKEGHGRRAAWALGVPDDLLFIVEAASGLIDRRAKWAWREMHCEASAVPEHLRADRLSVRWKTDHLYPPPSGQDTLDGGHI